MRSGWLVAAVLCCLLAACSKRTIPEAAVPEPVPSTSQAAKEPAVAIDVSRQAPETVLQKAVEACADLLAALPVTAENPYYPLSQEQTAAFLERIATTGAPVTAAGYDMRNYEQVIAFAEQVKRGETAQTGIIEVTCNGLCLHTLAQNEGQQMRLLTSAYFPGTEIKSGQITKTEQIELRPSGYLMYGIPDKDGLTVCGGYRVVPLGEDKREACRKYVEPVFFSAGKLMNTDWDEKNLTALDLQFAFETLYKLDKKFELYDSDYPQNPQTFTYAVPADEAERILTKYLPVAAQTIRMDQHYDAAQKVYHWGCFAGGGYSAMPEVVQMQDNGDGTLRLTVNSVAVEFGDECAAQCELTVRRNADGSFCYLSNKLL